jgi:hypothetical protein
MDVFTLRSLAELRGNAGFIAILGMLDEEVKLLQLEIMGVKDLDKSPIYLLKLQNLLQIKDKITGFVSDANLKLEEEKANG